ncbi:MAG: alpha-1,3/4-fucosidase [Bacteroidia bacterium]|nr:alpha-1,3/4-fucosidase [Bacteroidia bacterium]
MKRHIQTLLAVALCFSTQLHGQNIEFKNSIKIEPGDSREVIIEKAAHVVPTPNQLRALQKEFIAFIHFGPNTFTRMEWGNGMEDPKIFDLKRLDTDQWCEAIKAAGMKMVMLTVKHHDGFMLWQSRYTQHGIMSTNFQNGKGDILKALSASCKKMGLRLGIYLSPADLFQIESPEGLYGNLSSYTMRTIPREVPGKPFKNKTTFKFLVDDYNEYFLNQLFEVLTEYGPVDEVWFDGAHPKRKGGQTYNYTAWKKLIRTLAPKAVIFGKEDIRWCGNEAGQTRKTEWNVIPYAADPDTAQHFMDLTDKDLSSREKLYKATYLHYQPAETNTSIREGWFYRDETNQKVRSADDVFDMYERAVGGNSIFLLNIPPNREGQLSKEDVLALKETGKRIRMTYGIDLLKGAQGPQAVLDHKPSTSFLLSNNPKEIILSTNKPITLNRLVLQEAIATHGERVERHAVDGWINGAWKEIAQATNIGYKRILRFPDITTTKLRVRILESRLTPAISHISAHYYQARPPRLTATRDLNGFVTIKPLEHDFGWKAHGEDIASNLNAGFKIYYTTDGSRPTINSACYEQPFYFEKGEIEAIAIMNGEQGAVYHNTYGVPSALWKVHGSSDEKKNHQASQAFDANPQTYWLSEASNKAHFLSIDFGKELAFKGFAYTPQTENGTGMIEKGEIQISQDGENWQTIDSFEFGNLINDPVRRLHYFKKAVNARYFRINVKHIAGDGKVATAAELEVL